MKIQSRTEKRTGTTGTVVDQIRARRAEKAAENAKRASELFKERCAEAEYLMTSLKMKLAAFAEKQASEPASWGYAGSMGEVNSRLRDLVDFLTPEEEKQAEQDAIETWSKHLQGRQ